MGLCVNMRVGVLFKPPSLQGKSCLQKPHSDVMVFDRPTHRGPQGQDAYAFLN